MRQARALSGMIIGGAVALFATQPAHGAATQVTAVRLDKNGSELQLTLATKAGDEHPQVFTVSHGNDLVTDIVNTQLSLSQGDDFRQKNPMPGITSVVVNQLDENSVRVTVSGANRSPMGQVLQQGQQEITLAISTEVQNQEEISTSAVPLTEIIGSQETPELLSEQDSLPKEKVSTEPRLVAQTLTPKSEDLALTQASETTVAQTPVPKSEDLALTQASETTIAQTPVSKSEDLALTQASETTVAQAPVPQPVAPVQAPVAQPVTAPSPDVLIPNPRITIEGVPIAPADAAQPVTPAPPFLPRAVAPPVGDIAISNINPAASVIDLGTGVRVPRLVLREAPVREVLALLARAAGLNLAFTDQGAGSQPGAPGGAAGGAQQTISLDLENEPVQDVFNYVLRISGFQANRVGRTIFVGSRLPDAARNIIARTLRLNQVPVGQAVGFLISQGAEQQQITTQTTLTVVGEGAAAQRIQNTQTQVQRIAAQEVAQGAAGAGIGALVLRGLALAPDERLNSVTLVGDPRQVEVATALLTQLDLRRRQVAVNVKIIDVNLLGTDAFNASFSFGIGDSFFVSDGGAASFNYGPSRPPTSPEVTTSLATPTVVVNPYGPLSPTPGNTFIDFDNTTTVPGTGVGTRQITIDNTLGGGISIINAPPPDSRTDAAFFNRIAGASGNPFQAGITDFTLATPSVITTTISPGNPGQTVVLPNGTTTVTGQTGPTQTSTLTPGTLGTVTQSLPSLFQFPKRLLAALQAQITSGNAKILTDPTLVVQEGQTATVNLTQEVFGGFRLQTQTDPTTNLTTQVQEPIIKNAGLILQINVQRIDDNGFISMTVNPTVSAIAGAQNTPQGQITLINERQLSSGQIRLRDGQTLILSGIIQEADRTTVRKVPILGDIPILGALFRSTERSNQRQEVIVLLTPQIIDDSAGSSFGYTYTPGRDARQIMQQQGVSP